MSGDVRPILDQLDRIAIEAGARAAELEAGRTLPRDLVEGLIGGGVFRLLLPRSLGGAEADLGTALAAVGRAAERDGSTAWVAMSGILAGLDAARLARHHAEAVYADPRAVVAVVDSIGGDARPTDDEGLSVTGRWPWVAGAAACTWFAVGVRVVDDDGRPLTAPDGTTEVVAFLRRDQVVVLDTWHTLGLRAGGATDVEAVATVVPEGRWIVVEPSPVPAGPDDPTTGRPRPSASEATPLGVAAVALGLAARAVDTLADGAGRQPVGPTGATRAALAALAADVAAGRDHLATVAARLDPGPARSTPGPGTEPVTVPRSAPSVPATAIRLVDRAVEVVTRCHRLGGADAVYHASPLQRLLRDVATMSQHPAVALERLDEPGSPMSPGADPVAD